MQPKRIMIDGYNLALEKGTGVATYSKNLCIELKKLGHKIDLLYGLRSATGSNPLLNEINFFDTAVARKPLSTTNVVRTLAQSPFGLKAKEVPLSGKVIVRNPARILPPHDRILNYQNLYNYARWHSRIYDNRFLNVTYDTPADIAHWTYPLPVKLRGAANIYTLHDLVPLRLPYTTLDNKREYYNLIKGIVDHSDHIVTVSEASKRDIINLFGVSESRVTNTYQSVNLPENIVNRQFEDVCREVESLFGLEPKRYFLFFGAIEPKKNVGRIVEAYLSSQSELPLVLVGQVKWKDDRDLRLLTAIEQSQNAKNDGQAPGRVKRLDYLPLNLLTSLIRCARAVVFPSLYEGFGLPILEAMQLGTAVITGTHGSNPEVAGDAAYLVDPYDTDSIAKAIRDLESDEGMVQHYENAGRHRALAFSPELYSERLQSLYNRF